MTAERRDVRAMLNSPSPEHSGRELASSMRTQDEEIKCRFAAGHFPTGRCLVLEHTRGRRIHPYITQFPVHVLMTSQSDEHQRARGPLCINYMRSVVYMRVESVIDLLMVSDICSKQLERIQFVARESGRAYAAVVMNDSLVVPSHEGVSRWIRFDSMCSSDEGPVQFAV